MKNLLKISFALLIAGISFNAQAQEELKKKEITFEVNGKCGMCEERIENALDIKGVKFANWNKETQQFKVVFDPRKISEDDIHKAIADVGHDTEKAKATDEAYSNLHHCCKYDRKQD